jgi:hypothetical protein
MKTSAASYRMAIAARYWHSARIILQNQTRPIEFMEPVAYLLAMAAELTLKAYLTDSDYTDAQLSGRKIGHDLGACLRHAIQGGLEVSELEASCILSMRAAHLTHFNRYGPRSEGGNLALGAFSATDEQASLTRVGSLIDRVAGSPDTLRKLHGHPAPLDWPETFPLLRPVDMTVLAALEIEQQRELGKVAKINADFRRKGIVPTVP